MTFTDENTYTLRAALSTLNGNSQTLAAPGPLGKGAGRITSGTVFDITSFLWSSTGTISLGIAPVGGGAVIPILESDSPEALATLGLSTGVRVEVPSGADYEFVILGTSGAPGIIYTGDLFLVGRIATK